MNEGRKFTYKYMQSYEYPEAFHMNEVILMLGHFHDPVWPNQQQLLVLGNKLMF